MSAERDKSQGIAFTFLDKTFVPFERETKAKKIKKSLDRLQHLQDKMDRLLKEMIELKGKKR